MFVLMFIHVLYVDSLIRVVSVQYLVAWCFLDLLDDEFPVLVVHVLN